MCVAVAAGSRLASAMHELRVLHKDKLSKLLQKVLLKLPACITHLLLLVERETVAAAPKLEIQQAHVLLLCHPLVAQGPAAAPALRSSG